ncbi:MAG: type II secretion system protein GspD, partial [Rhodanobacter sp.]
MNKLKTSCRQCLTATLFASVVLLTSCSTTPPRLQLPGPLPLPAKPATPAEHELTRKSVGVMTQSATPRITNSGPTRAGANDRQTTPVKDGPPVSVNLQNIPVPAFVNAVFGEMLSLNVSMSPQVAALRQLVTLRTETKQRPQDLYKLAQQVLTDYGVSVSVDGNLVKLAISASGSSSEPPLIISGRASEEVPISHRPVFQLVELNAVQSNSAVAWLSTVFGPELKVVDEAGRNAIMISGKPVQVQQAVEALRVFDQPLMRGRFSTRLEPAFLSAEEMTSRLIDVLNTQGYSANRTPGSPSAVIVLPVPAVNSVLVFANTQQALDYATSWAGELDKPSPQAGNDSMFYYQVKNTKASDLATVLNGVSRDARKQTKDAKDGGAAPTGPSATASAGGAFIVDEPRNALIYRGDPAQWERTLTLVRQMDKAPRQVMIEVTIAEVTLDNDNKFGVGWFLKNGFSHHSKLFLGDGAGGPAGGGKSNGGLSYLVDIAGLNRVALTALATDKRVTIISSPHVLVKSGSEASIDVGTEVPTVSLATTSPQETGGTSNLLQSIQYRKTGTLLTIKPTVYSDDRVDLDISQEVSDAIPLAANATGNSPSILSRSLTTSLSLRDGGSVVMAGLISQTLTNSDTGVPLLKDIPILGNLFKAQDKAKNRTELVLMIVPYIIENNDQAIAVS